jgi:single-stranded-DNA-specific exonuclease
MLFQKNKSLKGRKWLEKQNQTNILPQQILLKNHQLSTKKLHDILLRRGHSDHDIFLNGMIKDYLTDPEILSNMDVFTNTLEQAIKNNNKICFLGDYDVDGATSTASFVLYLNCIQYKNFDFYIPDRITEGYGGNTNILDRFKKENGELLVILDSGTLSFDLVKHAKNIGLNVLILDHHDPHESGEIPDAILVNPKKREDEEHELQHLCTAGLAMLAILSLNRKLRTWYQDKKLPENPDIVIMNQIGGLTALGTVADVMKLKTLNRGFLKQFLPKMKNNKGLAALKNVFDKHIEEKESKTGKKLKRVKYDVYNCGFTFGPAINACGRIDDCMRGVKLLVEQDEKTALLLANEAYDINEERKSRQKAMEEECFRQAEEQKENAVIIAYNPEWHPGLVGLGAGKIKEKMDKPVVVIGMNGKGSARSIDGFDIGQAFRQATEQGIIIGGGGHSAAAGLTLNPEKLQLFKDFMNNAAKNIVRNPIEADMVIDLDNFTKEDIYSLQYMEPFGMGNPNPLFIFTGGIISYIKENSAGGISFFYKKGREKIKAILWDESGTEIGRKLLESEGKKADLLGKVEINSWNGVESLQIILNDLVIE